MKVKTRLCNWLSGDNLTRLVKTRIGELQHFFLTLDAKRYVLCCYRAAFKKEGGGELFFKLHCGRLV